MWKTKEGQYVSIKDMENLHSRNTLKLVIKKLSIECINMGAKYCSDYNVNKMTDKEVKELLTQYCEHPKSFKLIIAKQCFGPSSEFNY